MRNLDIGLLRTFVSVVDSGGFTRAGERVNRTQSTISQQVRRLEEQVGQPLLERSSRALALTDDGQRLLGYARRILALNDEAYALLTNCRDTEIVRIGLTEDYAAEYLPDLLDRLARTSGIRLQVRADLSLTLLKDLEAGDLDLAMVKQREAPTQAMASMRVGLRWYGAAALPVEPGASIPLAVFPQGCVYRNHAVHALEAAGRPWHVAYDSPNLSGIRAAVQAGLGVSPLSAWEVTAGTPPIPHDAGLPVLPDAFLCLYGNAPLGPGATTVADLLADSLEAMGGSKAA